MIFTLKLEPEAKKDIQEAIDWNNKKQTGLGRRFFEVLQKNLDGLSEFPFYQIRYGEKIRCLPLKTFPYMIHFTVDEQQNIVVIRAVFHTSKNPTSWKNR